MKPLPEGTVLHTFLETHAYEPCDEDCPDRAVLGLTQPARQAMSVLTLNPRYHLALPYSVPWNGRLRFEVESERPTTVLVFDSQNLALWRANQPSVYQWASANQLRHYQELRLPAGGLWFLVVVNPLATPTAVHYNVWVG